MVLTLKIRGRVIAEKKNRRDKVPIGTIHSVNPLCSVTLLHPLHKVRELNLSKIDGNEVGRGGGERGGRVRKIFTEK